MTPQKEGEAGTKSKDEVPEGGRTNQATTDACEAIRDNANGLDTVGTSTTSSSATSAISTSTTTTTTVGTDILVVAEKGQTEDAPSVRDNTDTIRSAGVSSLEGTSVHKGPSKGVEADHGTPVTLEAVTTNQNIEMVMVTGPEEPLNKRSGESNDTPHPKKLVGRVGGATKKKVRSL